MNTRITASNMAPLEPNTLHGPQCERSKYVLHVQIFGVSCSVSASVLPSPRSAPSAVSGCTVSSVKGQYCPQQPRQLVNHLFDAYGAVCHKGHIVRCSSDFWTQNKSMLNLRKFPPSTPRAEKIPEREAVRGKGEWGSNGWISVITSDRSTVNLIF